MKRGDLGYWEWRKNTGRPKSIATPEILWKYACDYFQMRDESPWPTHDVIRSGDNAGKNIYIDKQEPYTWEGLDDYLFEHDVISRLEDYKANKDNRYAEFVDVVTRIRKIMYDQKFRGAAIGAFKENIIARDLGLTDKTENTIIAEQPLFPDAE